MWLRNFRLGSAWLHALFRRPSVGTGRDAAEISSELAAVIVVIGEDRSLQSWFCNIASLPDNLRVSAVGRLVSEMSAAGEDPKVVDAFGALGSRTVCRTVARILRERYSVAIPEIDDPDRA